MPVKSGTVKIFLGNLGDAATSDVIRPLFEAYGKVVEADVIKNYGFVHMEEEADARRAISELNGHEVAGKPMVVELSTGLNKRGSGRRGNVSLSARGKIFVGNVPKDATVDELRQMFADFGTVVEADIISNYAFVHMENEDQAVTAIEALHGTELHGQDLRVQLSTSSVRQVPGMDRADICFRCGSHGHWSKDCTGPPVTPYGGAAAAGGEMGYGGASWAGYSGAGGRDRGRYAPYPAYAPPPPAYRRDVYYDAQPRRDPYYEQAYYSPYDEYEMYDRRRAAAAAAALPPMHDPYGPPPPRRYPAAAGAAAAAAAEEPLYDRRVPTTYRLSPTARRMY